MFAMVLSFCSFRARARRVLNMGTVPAISSALAMPARSGWIGPDESKHPWAGLPLDADAASQPVRALRRGVPMWSSDRSRALLVRGIPRPVRSASRVRLLLRPLSQGVDRNRSDPLDGTPEP